MKRAHVQAGAYVVTAIALLTATQVLLSYGRHADFAPYFRMIDPRLATIAVAISGGLALAILSRNGWLPVVTPQPLAAVLWFLATCPFAAMAILADILFGFPRDINVPIPWALLFYPLMGFVVEVLFHALPLAIIALAAGVRLNTGWTWLVLVALLEPAFQFIIATAEGGANALAVFVFLHVLAINLCELHIFRRHGFIVAWSFRVSYYLLWHVAWGHWRLL